jgi:hypothetical protein
MMNRFIKQIIQKYIKNNSKNFYEFYPGIDSDLKTSLKIFKNLDFQKILKNEEIRNKLDILKKIKKLKCKNCEGSGYAFDQFFSNIYRKFEKICQERPPSIPEFDQGFIKPKDVIKRVQFIYERGDLLNSKIIILGDDDLISIALTLTNLPQEIYVIEIDKRLTDFISKKSQEFKLPIKTLEYDARKPVPKYLLKKFDIFITDPVETLNGLKIFLSRCMLCLKNNGAGYFGLTHLESSLKKWYALENFIINSGFVITDIIKNFSVYPTMEDKKDWGQFKEKLPIYKLSKNQMTKEWYFSDFIRIEKIKNKKIENKEINIGNKLYMDEETLATPIV